MLEVLSSLDRSLFLSINDFAGRSDSLDSFTRLIERNDLFKGFVFMMLFWGMWFAAGRFGSDTREKLLGVLVVALVAIFVGRLLALVLPFRIRPMHTLGLDYNHPYKMPRSTLKEWSSMPSDHAVLYFALAVGLGFVSRVVGAILLVYAAFVISLPRVYLGLHFPGDILAGALIGGGISLILMPRLTRLFVDHGMLERLTSHPQFFYPAMFFVTFQAASMFDSLRQLGTQLSRIVQLALR